MSGGLACVADRAIRNPLVQVSTAVTYRARRNLDEIRPPATVPPVLQGTDGVAKDRRGFAFVHELVRFLIGLHGGFLKEFVL